MHGEKIPIENIKKCIGTVSERGNEIEIPVFLKFIYSEKATIFCETSAVDLSYIFRNGQIYGGDFTKFRCLLRIYELY